MGYEISRQFVHLGGLVFVLLAQFTGRFIASIIFFIIALAFFIYSESVRKEKGIFGSLEYNIRSAFFKLERDGIKRPFMGAFWFYFALGLTFLIFPLEIAMASGLMLSIGDSLSTMVGLRYGEHKIFGRKSLEGSLAFFLSSFLITAALLGYLLVEVAPVLVSFIAFLGSISATFVELIPEAGKIRNWKNKGIVDDNWLIPLFSGLIIYVAYILTGIV